MEDCLEKKYEYNMQALSLAFNYCRENFLHEDIINELYNENDLKKQLCLIELSEIKNQAEANILVSNLTLHDGLIRENTSFKVLELIKNIEYKQFFQTEDIMESFVKSLTDINPSISRNTIEILKYIDNPFYIYKKLIEAIKNILNEPETIKRSYTNNKKNFGLYWNIEGLISISDKITPNDDLVKIFKITAKSNDYTIREKTAKAAKNFKLNQITNLLKYDENIYVQRYIKDDRAAIKKQ